MPYIAAELSLLLTVITLHVCTSEKDVIIYMYSQFSFSSIPMALAKMTINFSYIVIKVCNTSVLGGTPSSNESMNTDFSNFLGKLNWD